MKKEKGGKGRELEPHGSLPRSPSHHYHHHPLEQGEQAQGPAAAGRAPPSRCAGGAGVGMGVLVWAAMDFI